MEEYIKKILKDSPTSEIHQVKLDFLKVTCSNNKSELLLNNLISFIDDNYYTRRDEEQELQSEA
jgi:hypothetical protein